MAAWALPVLATLGSLAAGAISDKLMRGRRAPVAAVLYFVQFVCIVLAILMSQHLLYASATMATVLVLGIHTGCNATHSILGSAAAMDLGGRKMAGFASGVIDSFQYFGAMLAGFGLGTLLDYSGVPVAPAATQSGTVSALTKVINPTVWFASMLPWGLLGTVLMVYVWIRHGASGKAGT
jgi:sugar phosphate permease